MRGFATLLLLAVALFVGYTYWHVTRLEKDVGQIKLRVGIASTQKPGAEESDLRRLIAQAGETCRRAQAFLDKGESKKAKQEIGLCLRKLSEASKLAKNAADNKEFREGWEQVTRQLDKLWKRFAEEPERKKGS